MVTLEEEGEGSTKTCATQGSIAGGGLDGEGLSVCCLDGPGTGSFLSPKK